MTVVPAVALMKNGVSPSSMDSTMLLSVLQLHSVRSTVNVYDAIFGQRSEFDYLPNADTCIFPSLSTGTLTMFSTPKPITWADLVIL
jgi:hypothetical protein